LIFHSQQFTLCCCIIHNNLAHAKRERERREKFAHKTIRKANSERMKNSRKGFEAETKLSKYLLKLSWGWWEVMVPSAVQ
jgi:hypothetical protein